MHFFRDYPETTSRACRAISYSSLVGTTRTATSAESGETRVAPSTGPALRASGDPGAALAFDVYCYRIRKYVGAYYAVLGTVHAVVFTAGVGQHSAELRAAALSGLDRLGIVVDDVRNTGPVSGPTFVSPDGSDVAVLVIPTDEEYEIARQALEVTR